MQRTTYRQYRHQKKQKPRVAAIGTFDGVHYGHRRLIQAARDRADELNAELMVLTFWPPPAVFLADRQEPHLLTTREEKALLLAELGVDELVTKEFDEKLARMSPQSFCHDILRSGLGVDWVYVGFDFTFGHLGGGSARDLQSLGPEKGFSVQIIDPVTLDGRQVSSTLIRQLLVEGAADQAARMLQRPYRLRGEVVKGAQRGSKLGFPTANLTFCPQKVRPKPGVYQLRVCAPEKDITAADAVGHTGGSPTFGPDAAGNQLEVHIIDFSGSLYETELTCDVLRWIRPNFEFGSHEKLAEQIRRDIQLVLRAESSAETGSAGGIDTGPD